MTKRFEYRVNGTAFEDTEAFGKAWEAAKEKATVEHTYIERTVINGNDIRYEFYAKSGIFLNERFMEVDKVYIF